MLGVGADQNIIKVGVAMFAKLPSPLLMSFFLLLTSCREQEQSAVVAGPAASPVTETTPQVAQAQASPEAMPFAIFPAQTRELAAAEVLDRGATVYESLCRACHGQDLRGGDQGGPNLLRSQVVLNDQHGELIGEVIQNGRRTPGMPEMPPLQVSAEDRVAVAEYIHSVWANQSGQGGPPSGEEVELDIVVGDAGAGEAWFNAQCTGCHAANGDLQGIASRIPDPENLQNSWVAGRRWGAPDPNADPSRRQVRATVTLDNGDTVFGVLNRRDDFIISLTTDAGHYASFTLHENTTPAVTDIVIDDPLQRHRDLLSELTNDIMHDVTAYLVTLK
jgi:cytochrome c oxidase cbb3-type subunit 3